MDSPRCRRDIHAPHPNSWFRQGKRIHSKAEKKTFEKEIEDEPMISFSIRDLVLHTSPTIKTKSFQFCAFLHIQIIICPTRIGLWHRNEGWLPGNGCATTIMYNDRNDLWRFPSCSHYSDCNGLVSMGECAELVCDLWQVNDCSDSNKSAPLRGKSQTRATHWRELIVFAKQSSFLRARRRRLSETKTKRWLCRFNHSHEDEWIEASELAQYT